MKILALLAVLVLPVSASAAGAPFAAAGARLLAFSADARGYVYVIDDRALAGALATRDAACSRYAEAQETVIQFFRASAGGELRTTGPAVLTAAQRRFQECASARKSADDEAVQAASRLNFRNTPDVSYKLEGERVRVYVPRASSLATALVRR